MVLREVLGIGDSGEFPTWMRASTIRRLTDDLEAVARLADVSVLKKEYQNPLKSGERGTVEEVFAIARLSNGAVSVDLHQPTGRGNRNCDAKVTISTCTFAVEVKHRRDDFPFNAAPQPSPDGLAFFQASRPGADHRYLDLPRPDTTQPIPGSHIWRATVLDAIEQLPDEQAGIVALSIEAFGDHDIDVEAALYGDEVLLAKPKPEGIGSTHEWTRIGNGVFSQANARSLVGVYAFRLRANDDDSALLPDWVRWYPNPSCVVANRSDVSVWLESVVVA